MPAPFPACLPFSASSALASSTSLRISVVASSENCLRSSPALPPLFWVMRSPDPGGSRHRLGGRADARSGARRCRTRELRTGGFVRLRALASAVSLAARGLQETSRRQSHDYPAGEHCPRLAPAEVLDVTEDSISVRVTQIAGGPIDPIRRLLR